MNETVFVTATFLFSPSFGLLVCIMSRLEFTSMSKLTCITSYYNDCELSLMTCIKSISGEYLLGTRTRT